MSSKRKLPIVAIAGKRNAGKSTLLNALVGKNRAITDATPGLTRDILQELVKKNGYEFILCDTPGLDMDGHEALEAAILERTREFLATVDVVVFLVEPPGPTPFDLSLLEFFRKNRDLARIVFVLNKIDKEREGIVEAEFYAAGFPELIHISALGRKNLPGLLKEIGKRIPDGQSRSFADGPAVDCSVCIVGKPNAGKSSLLNRLSGKELSLVSEIPGTTRDSVDSIFTYYGKTIRLTDTAGLKKTGKLKDNIEYYSMNRTRRAITESEVVIHLLDAQQGITDYDKKIVSTTEELDKPAVFAVNKWDAVEEKNMKEFLDRMYFMFPHAKTRPIVFISALTGVRIGKVIEEALKLKERLSFRVPTAKLNQWLVEWNRKLASAPRKAKIYYATQAGTSPPEFIFFVNQKENFRPDVLAYFENRIREDCDLLGVPLRIKLRQKETT
ncbi:MAG: ribosome biogenesis GTPase Der [Leptospirales bacterium]|nr:ribosome biogenesis GTPase Der [Leptospirales bacterium]